MWIVRLALRRPYTFIVASILLLILGTVAIVRTPTDIFPNIDIPVVSVLWTYQRSFARGHVEPDCLQLRAIPHHDGQRHRTRGIAILERTSHRQGFFPSGSQYWKCCRSNHCDFSNGRAFAAARHAASARHSIQRIVGPHPATCAFRPRAERAATRRPGLELPADGPGDRAGHRDPLSLRGEAASGGDRPESVGIAVEGTVCRSTSSMPSTFRI